MNMKRAFIVGGVLGVIGIAAAYATIGQARNSTYNPEHTHDGGLQHDPSHSGGTDRNGCHNASVPYHCH